MTPAPPHADCGWALKIAAVIGVVFYLVVVVCKAVKWMGE